jgi:hypothetical protein
MSLCDSTQAAIRAEGGNVKKIWLSASVAIGLFTASQTALAKGPTVWVVPSSLIRIGPTEQPGKTSTVTISAARGEYQAFQVAIQAPVGNLSNLNFSVSSLYRIEPNRGGSENSILDHEMIPEKNLVLYREKNMTVLKHSPTYNGPPNLPITNKDTFPDALIPFIDPATGRPPVGGNFVAIPFELMAGHNAVIWVDAFIPRTAKAGLYAGIYTVTSAQGTVQGLILAHVWDFTLPLKPSLKSSFNGGGTILPGVNEELLRNKLMPDTVNAGYERKFINKYGLSATDIGFWSNVSYGQCEATAPPSLRNVGIAIATHQPDLNLYDETADPESSCTSESFYQAMINWGQVLHKAGINNLVTQQPVPQLYNDGLGTGRSAVDIWTMLPQNYNDAQSQVPPAVTFILNKGDKAWSYNDLVQEAYSPKWELDFLPIDYRIQPGFISQSLRLTGLLYWSVDDWSADPWENPQGNQDPDYPGEGILVYPGPPAGLRGVAPSMRLKYLRDGVQDYEYIQILKNCGQGAWALDKSRKVGRDWTNWTRDSALLESVRLELGNRIAALGCSR